MNELVKKHILPTVVVIILLLLIFYAPYIVYTTFNINNNKPILGLTYYYQNEELYDIYTNIELFYNMNIRILRIPFLCNIDNPTAWENNKTRTLYDRIKNYDGLYTAVMCFNPSVEELKYYLNNYGERIKYFQILNEPEILKGKWGELVYFMDEELKNWFTSTLENIHTANRDYNYSFQVYTNFSPAFLVRPNIPVILSEYIDFAGLDVYTDAGLVGVHYLYKLLKSLTNKNVIITEVGSCVTDKVEQKDFIMKALDIFKDMKVEQVWIFNWGGGETEGSWNAPYSNYDIKGNTELINALREWS